MKVGERRLQWPQGRVRWGEGRARAPTAGPCGGSRALNALIESVVTGGYMPTPRLLQNLASILS